jgi:DNA repair protein RadD
MKLRDYQVAAVASIFDYFEKGGRGNPIVALPTGTGKSVVIGAFIQQALERYPGTRVMKLTHVKELIQQNLEKLLAIWPTAPAGVYSAGLGRKDLGHPILFGGVGTVARGTPDLFGRVDLLLIDECHLVSPKESTMYQAVIRGLREINPALKVIGFTATHYRLGHGMLTEQGGLFTDVCFDMTRLDSFNWLLAEGYLSRLVPRPTATTIDLSGVHIHGGEYKSDELQSAVDKDEITYSAVQEMIAYSLHRNHWLIFASGIVHAIHISAMLDSLGIPATHVHSKMSAESRDANILGFKQGKYRAMVNNGILTTGFDFPEIDLIGMLRPTQSPSLWVQMLGRGTRPVYAGNFDLSTAEGRNSAIAAGPKQNCLVLDFAGNTRRLGPINDPVLPRKKGKGNGVAPVKLCEACGTYNHASVRFCENCGAEFPKEVKILRHAGSDALIADSSEEPVTETFKVDKVIYSEHRKDGRPPTIQVSYFCGLRMFKEWVCLEHDGYAAKKARDWWRERALDEPPETTEDALKAMDILRTPTHIRVWLKPKYDEILSYDYSGTAFGEQP